MRSSYIPLLNKIKNAIQRKKLVINISFNNQNLKFILFLQKNNLISGFKKKNTLLMVFLKYNLQNVNAIKDFSILHKKWQNLKQSNFIFNNSSKTKSCGKSFVINLLTSKAEKQFLGKFR